MSAARVWILVLALSASTGACSVATTPRADVAEHVAQCPVCTWNNDLACETVKVDQSTPTVTHDGRTYYFCSEHCRHAFLENPGAYVEE